ncbi:Metalloenzyme LuxS/M16 peptidase-like [Trinorchestia longiramus]|nr:Metalloenzyme LuxS/M16 peptidase-like [Trinorchestia longiramus]
MSRRHLMLFSTCRLYVVADSESRRFSGVIPLDVPQFQSPVRQLINGILSTPVTFAPKVHKFKNDVAVFASGRSFGKSIDGGSNSDNDLSVVTAKADFVGNEEAEDPFANGPNDFFNGNRNKNGVNDKRVVIIHGGSAVHDSSGSTIGSKIDSVLNSNNVRNTLHTNTGSAVKANSDGFGGGDTSVFDSGSELRTLGLLGSLKNSSTTLEMEGPVGMVAGAQDSTAWVYGLPEADSGYLQQSAVSITQYTHWHLPALLTAIQYFTQLEGPMWREIRGRGLAYNYDLQVLPSEGLITLKLTRAAQLLEAYEESISMLRGFINGSREWDPLLLESAKSSLMFEVIYREETVSDVVQQSLLAYYRKVPLSYNRDLLALIAGVSLEEARWAARQYLTPLLHPSSSRTVVVCDPSEVDETIAVLSSLGHTAEEVTSLSNSWFV